MALNPAGLAKEIANALGESTVSPILVGWATGVITEVKLGIATFGNTASGHKITGVLGPSMAQKIALFSGYPGTSPELIAYATAISAHILSSAVVTYTSPFPNPPAIPPSAAWFLGGTISGMSGSTLARLIATALGQPTVSPQLLKKATAIVDHITKNAQVTAGVIT